MQWKQPKNTDKYQWTQHVTEKMHYYGLSEQKVLGVIRNPFRTETGIVENTVAVMAPVGNLKKDSKPLKWKKTFSATEDVEKWNQEIWVMYQFCDSKTKSKIQMSNIKQIPNFQNQNVQKLNNLMQLKAKKLVIISAWRYPGVSPKNNPIPEEILREMEMLI